MQRHCTGNVESIFRFNVTSLRFQRSATPDGPAVASAKSVCGATDRIDPAGVPEPFRDPERPASAEDASGVLPLLPSVAHPPRARQAVSDRTRGDGPRGVIVEKPELGGLHHRYERVAA